MMLQGVPGLIGSGSSSGEGAPASAVGGEREGGGVGGGFSEEDRARIEESERNSGGNRWPRQETVALLKIRSDMDVAFRDSSPKGPLWDEVCRKMAELGFRRSAKKCKEKFENVYKYHRRTKEGRASKPEGKTYRFFDQLEALDTHPPPPPLPSSSQPAQLLPPRPPPPVAATPISVAMPGVANPQILPQVSTVPLQLQTTTASINPSFPPPVQPLSISTTTAFPPPPPPQQQQQQPPIINRGDTSSGPASSDSTSSSWTSSEVGMERRRKRKRKWKEFFERMMRQVVEKQEELQNKLMEALEKRERDRMIREEAWRAQETARINREHTLLAQERSMAASKDAEVIAFLQKVTEQQNQENPIAATQPPAETQIKVPEIQIQQPQPPTPTPPPPPPPQPVQAHTTQQPPQPQPPQLQPIQLPVPAQPMQQPPPQRMLIEAPKHNNGGENLAAASSSRWPKAEVEALIRLRTDLDLKYQENGPKGPLWEDISAAMARIGYNRSSKRCKEKWENINKYFKKVKESNKKRPEDSKTCPYFNQLDALYRAKSDGSYNSGFSAKHENPAAAPIMARPEQQWPFLPETNRPESAMDDPESENTDDDDGDDEDDGGSYEIVTNKPSSMASTMD